MVRTLILFAVGGVTCAGALLWLNHAGRDAASTGSAAYVLFEASELSLSVEDRAGVATSDQVVTFEQLAAIDPLAALETTLTISDAVQQRRAAESIAAIWVASDPLAALAAAEQLPPRLWTAYRTVIDSEWARLDPAAYLAFVKANPDYLEELVSHGHYEAGPILESSDGIRLLLASDPLSVMDLADELSSRLGATLKTMAIGAYAERDPIAAIALVDQMPPGQERDEARNAVATGYALADPEGALAWAESLSPPPASLLGNILNVIAQTDMSRAMRLGAQMSWSGSAQYPPINALVIKAAEDSTQATLAADALLAVNAPRRDYRLSILLQLWAGHDPESVINWINANAAMIGGESVTGAAFGLATRDPVIAAGYTERLPFALRAAWIERVAQGYGTADGAGALEWISQYEGQDGYEIGMRLVLTHYATDDPVAAARALPSVDPQIQLGAVAVIADQWGRQDGAGAAEWANRLTDPDVRAAALPEAVGAWMSQSSQQAEDWTLGMPRGADRDRVLQVLLQGRLYSNQPRERYSTNPTETLIAQISDPGMRGEVEGWFSAR